MKADPRMVEKPVGKKAVHFKSGPVSRRAQFGISATAFVGQSLVPVGPPRPILFHLSEHLGRAKMSEVQNSLWKKMTGYIQDFYHGKVNFHKLVCELQEAVDLANFTDRELMGKWYHYFNPLEEADSEAWYEMKELDFEKIKPYLQRLKEFLLEEEEVGALSSYHHAVHHKLAHSRG